MTEDIQEKPHKCTTCTSRCGKLDVYDWLADLPDAAGATDMVEVQFKNTRKGYYLNGNHLPLKKGDVVAVEASPGHDIGVITLTGALVLLQMKKNSISPSSSDVKRVYRKAKPVDIDKWEEAKGLEHETMLESRRIAERLKLNMKIGDVEYQGDRTKAIFYYIADERVDFRELIKVLADRFKIRVEMRQIGARQEAGRIGGIGPCGRELCCSTWMTNFVSVTTNSARYQEISLNPQKLAGQCGKLKCCLNYELDAYIDAQQDFPSTNIQLHTTEAIYYHFKTDIFKRTMWYTTQPGVPTGMVAVSVDRVKEVIALNRKGHKVHKLEEEADKGAPREIGYHNVVGEESLTRFDDRNRHSKNKRRPKGQMRQGDNRQGGQTQGHETPQQGNGPQDNRPHGEHRHRPDNRGPKPQQGENKPSGDNQTPRPRPILKTKNNPPQNEN
ncbi:MAG: regulatory iron-sulfur-containing complex subunit RicT [Breznakibacter sp.]